MAKGNADFAFAKVLFGASAAGNLAESAQYPTATIPPMASALKNLAKSGIVKLGRAGAAAIKRAICSMGGRTSRARSTFK
ncbi:MAG TPA: hypothetical protein VFH95_07300 [Candidatus Kapabacteria bacterium]|nr:hypothetical protein [Candidatus Kapabacteria bacterium]